MHYITKLLAAMFCFATAAGLQTRFIRVRGRLICGNESLKNTKVKLWNKQKFALASRNTNADGYYELQGGIESGSKADIVLKIYHHCDFNQFYLTERIDIKRWFEAGTLNMQLQFSREKKHCDFTG
ncbi:unnamed protein product [Gongylonema pulchrum]|uniref:Transthyretin-like family protein n=1 Tax=Gongylonema pulchrum TaxID=637853 RepID=A0A183E445_9BILA|nr:unnamed protein product [Gongylonema pulchrum]